MDPVNLKTQVSALFQSALREVSPTPEDRENLLEYGRKAAAALVVAATTTGAAKEAALDEAQGFADAASAMVARYELVSARAGRKTVAELLLLGLRVAIAALG